MALRILLDLPAGAVDPQQQSQRADRFCSEVPREFRVERPGRLDRKSGTAVPPVLPAQQAALQGVHVLDRNRIAEQEQSGGELRHAAMRGGRTPQNRLHVFARKVRRPRPLVDPLPRVLAHLGMMRDRVLAVVQIHVRMHPFAFLPQDLVVLRSRKRGEAEEFEDVEGKLLFDDLDVLGDRFGIVEWKTKDVSGGGDGAGILHASSILRYSVILFCRFLAASRFAALMLSRPISTRLTPARVAFSMKFGILWHNASTWMTSLIFILSRSRSAMRRSKIASQSLLRARLSSVIKKSRMPSAQCSRTVRSTSFADRPRDFLP